MTLHILLSYVARRGTARFCTSLGLHVNLTYWVVRSKNYKLLSWPYMTTKYGVSYTVGKVLQSTLRICKVWVTKPNYLVARGPWRLKNGEKIRFGGFEAVRGHIPMRSKVILKAPWVMVLTQPQKKFCSIYFCEIGPSFFNFEGPWPPNSLVWWPKSSIS